MFERKLLLLLTLQKKKKKEKKKNAWFERKIPILIAVTLSPQALRSKPILLAVTPLPSPLTTPPVTSTYFIFFLVLNSILGVFVFNGFSILQWNENSKVVQQLTSKNMFFFLSLLCAVLCCATQWERKRVSYEEEDMRVAVRRRRRKKRESRRRREMGLGTKGSIGCFIYSILLIPKVRQTQREKERGKRYWRENKTWLQNKFKIKMDYI